MNFTPKHLHEEPIERPEQLMLFEKLAEHQKSERFLTY